jgi:hypothetical protein
VPVRATGEGKDANPIEAELASLAFFGQSEADTASESRLRAMTAEKQHGETALKPPAFRRMPRVPTLMYGGGTLREDCGGVPREL